VACPPVTRNLLLSAEIDLSRTRQLQLVAAVQICRALGGGCSDAELKKLIEKPAAAME
jgi:hypothetical protein